MKTLMWSSLLLVGCVPEGEWVEVGPETDLDRYVAMVQPILEARCANPTCHGDAGRPLALYAPRLYRLDEERTWLDEPLTDEELELNHRRARAFLSEPVEESQLLRKPLDEDAGGAWHDGGVQFADASEPEFLAVLAWVTGLPLDLEENP